VPLCVNVNMLLWRVTTEEWKTNGSINREEKAS